MDVILTLPYRIVIVLYGSLKTLSFSEDGKIKVTEHVHVNVYN